jgi:uncharacterized iron-regulated membrane protein
MRADVMRIELSVEGVPAKVHAEIAQAIDSERRANPAAWPALVMLGTSLGQAVNQAAPQDLVRLDIVLEIAIEPVFDRPAATVEVEHVEQVEQLALETASAPDPEPVHHEE